ncbi:hypothetical protein Bint_0343 [Brachyspira intermedia PWS/A]|uniref:Lipoprotein n=1 Tax=Brachyspira intermedia (strain ATCC 51140 / PWS/A) TaxID=1045858 RepID=G0EIG9_BRAIP|nr:hypothetical protein [Brachyspira intermedia]AEM20977.1 hypothetical protein Bint_0343 [Brachyspira intermedia PWS/A]
MNKKLLLILSILMSLSLFTMSCAKSVAAPDSITGIVGGEVLTEEQAKVKINSALNSLGKIYDDTLKTGYFNFSVGSLTFDGNRRYVFFLNFNQTGVDTPYVKEAEILNNLKTALQSYNGEVIFTPDANWISSPDNITSGYYILRVSISSLNYNLPNTIKYIYIYLYANFWQ